MAGVGMLEVLIALLVLSIGVLGVAQLQGLSTRQNHDAYLRSQATFLAFSIADRMRSNQEQAADYVIAMNATVTDIDNQAKKDLNLWLTTIKSQLPCGDGEVAAAGDIYTIVVGYNIATANECVGGNGNANNSTRKPVRVAVETEVAR